MNHSFFQLEPRLLFDASAADASDHVHDDGGVHADFPGLAYVQDDAQVHTTVDDGHDQGPSPEEQGGLDLSVPTNAEIFVIDASVGDRAALEQSILESRGPDAVIIRLDAATDGITSLSQALAQYGNIDAVHIFSHGSDGQVHLGSVLLDNQALDERGAEIAAWGASINTGGDILLYGCDVAKSATGQVFTQGLADLTGADVAASDNATGAADKGGDWVLENETGSIEAGVLAVTGFDGLLAAPTITDAATTTRTVSEDTALTITGITIADSDSDNQTVTLTATNGTLTLAATSGLTGLSGNNTGTVTFSGTLAQVNAAINGMTFQGLQDFNGDASFEIKTNDGSTDATKTIAISVTAVNDAPDLSTKTDLTVDEGGHAAFSLQQLATDQYALDVDIQTGQQQLVQQMVQIKSLPTDGTLTYKGGPVVVDTVVPVTELGSLVFTHNGDDLAAPKTVSFNVAVSDGGGAVTNGTLNIVINPVNKAPTISGNISLYEGQSKAVAPTIDLGDSADTLANSTITISNVVTGNQGSFFIDANGNGVMDSGEEFTGGTLTATQLAQFKFIQNGYEPNTPGAVSPSYTISVQDSGGRDDGTGTKLTTTETITLTVLPNNDQPVLHHNLYDTAGTALEVDERSTTPITNAMLQVTDPDLDPANPSQPWPAANIVYTVEQRPVYGQLRLEVSPGVWKSLDVGGRFTQADIDGGKLKYYQSANLTGTDPIPEVFKFTVRDSAFGYELPTPDNLGDIVPGAVREGDVATGNIRILEFHLSLNPVNGTGGTDPTFDILSYEFDQSGTNFNGAASGWKEGNAGSDGVITPAMLKYEITRTIGGTAIVLPASETVYTLTALPTNGVIQRDTGSGWQTLDINANFTQADINGGKIRFVHDGGEDFINSFGFKVSDGTDQGSQDATFTIHVAPVNDRPTGSGGSVNVLEGNGKTVRLGSDVLGMRDVDGTTDTEPNATNTTGNVLWNDEGLADSLWFKIVTGPATGDSTGQGKLQYWNGTVWTDITPGAELWLHSSILTETADGQTSGLRYVHDGSEPLAYIGGPKLTFTYQVRDDLAAPGNAFDTNTSVPDATGAGTDQAHVSATVNATIGIIPVNNAPLVADKPGDADPDITSIGTINDGGDLVGKNEILTDVPEGGTATITKAYLTAVDSDNTRVQRQYRITSAPTLGVLQLDGKTLGIGSTFTQKDIDDNKVTYKHNGDEVGALTTDSLGSYHDKFHFVVNDGVLEDSGNVFLITLKPMNDKPTVATPASLDVLANGTNTVAVPGVSVDDPDLADIIAGSEEDFIRVEVEVLNSGGMAVTGALLNYTGGDPSTSPRSYNHGKGTNTLIIQGTKTQVNTALGNLTVAFTSDEDVSTHKIRVTVDDRLYTSGGALETGANGGINATTNTDGTSIDATNNRVSKEITLTASNTNDAPTITNATAYSVNEDGSVTLNGFTLNDADSFDRNVTVTVELFKDSGRTTLADAATEGKLTYSGLSNVTADGNGTNTVTLIGTMANVQAALNQIKFEGATDYNGIGSGDSTLYLKTTFTDFGHADKPAGNSVTVDNTITIKPVNDAPVLTVPGNQTMASGTYIDITADFNVQDDKDTNQGATDYIEVTLNAQADGSDYGTLSIEHSNLSSIGVTVESNGSSTIVVKGKNADVTTALNTLRYTPTNANVDKIVTIKVTADDRSSTDGDGNGKEGTGVGGNNTDIKSFTITISGTNDAPVVTVPSPISVAEDSTGTTISGISYTDTDDFGGTQRITVEVTHGTLDFGTKTGLTLQESTNYGSNKIIIEGTKVNLNAALATLKYTPTGNYHGSDTLIVIADDKGLVGTGGVKTDTKTLAITVTPVNDRPTASTDVTLTAINEDSTPSGVAFNTLNFGYSDATDDQTSNSGNDTSTAFTYIAITGNAATAAQGVWQVSDGNGGWIDIPTSGLSNTSALIFDVSREVRFLPAEDFNGTPGKLTVRLADGSVDMNSNLSSNAGDTKNLTTVGNLGNQTGAWNNDNRTIGISVTAINDAPTKTGTDPSFSVPEDATNPAGKTVLELFGSNFSDAKDQVTGGSSANSLAGVAITSVTTEKGVWEYSTDGTNWIAVPSDTSDSSAFVLKTTDQLRFRSTDLNYNGTPTDSLTVRLIDNSGAVTSGNRPDLSGGNSGGTTQYSDGSNTVTLGAVVTPTNDIPTFTEGGQTTGIAVTVTETDAVTGTGNAFEVALLTNVAVGDIDLSTTTGLVNGTFGAGSITVTLTDKIDGDILTVDSGLGGIASVTAYNPTTGQLVINLKNDATITQVQNILQAVKYAHQSDDPTNIKSGTEQKTRDFTVELSDGNNVQTGGNAGGPNPLTAMVSGTINITPVNDPPVAENNVNSVTEDSGNPATGNVITDDNGSGVDSDLDTPIADLKLTQIQGKTTEIIADGTTSTSGGAVVQGKYGTLTIGADGSYSYALDNSNPAVNALNDGQTLNDEVFTYTLSDGDKTDTATLTITINGHTDGGLSITPVDGNSDATGHATVHEKGLDGGSGDPADKTTTGSITVTAGDGIASVTIGGTTFTVAELDALLVNGPSAAIDTDEGELRITGISNKDGDPGAPTSATVSYTYTLKERQDHSAAPGTEVTDTIAISVTDKSATPQTATGTLTIQIVDDVPTAAPDNDTVKAGETLNVTGNGVLSNDQSGADGWKTSGGVIGVQPGSSSMPTTNNVGTEITGTYGKLTLSADGSYTYVANPAATGAPPITTDVFTYTVEDADGDRTTATLTITIQNNQPPVAKDDTRTTPEDIPVSGNVIKDGGPGDVTDSDPDNDPLTVTRVVVGGGTPVDVPTNGTPVTVDIPGKGTLVIDKTGSYTFTPVPDWHGDVPTITYTVDDGKNASNSTATADLKITVTPVPDAVNDGATINMDTPITLNPLDNDKFSDPGAKITAVSIPGNGKVVINLDGTVIYTPNPGFVGQDSFTYTVTTSGGQTETATVTIVVAPVNNANPPGVSPPAKPAGPPPTAALPDPGPFGPSGGLPPYTPAGSTLVSAMVREPRMLARLVELSDFPRRLEVAYVQWINVWPDEQSHNVVQVPPEAFSVLTGSEIRAEVRLADGSPLPFWISFDLDARALLVDPPADVRDKSVTVKIWLWDERGNEAVAAITLNLQKEARQAAEESAQLFEWEAQEVVKGVPGRTVPVALPMESRYTEVLTGSRVTITAVMADGTPLPEGLELDPRTGEVNGTVSVGNRETVLDIRVIAVDELGNRSEVLHHLHVVPERVEAALQSIPFAARPSFSAQLAMLLLS